MLKVVDIGEIYTCNFGAENGSVQGGIRPCIIVDNKNACVFSPCIHCVPLTTQSKKDVPLHYELFQKDYVCLESDSTVLCEQYTLVDKTQLGDKIGRLAQIDLIRIIDLCKRNLPYQYG